MNFLAKYGENYGIGRRLPLCEEAWIARKKTIKPPFRTMTDDELLAHYGRFTPEQMAEHERRAAEFAASRQPRHRQAAE